MTYRNSQTDDQSTKLSQRVRATAAASWLAIRTWLTALCSTAAALPQRLASMASGLFLEPPSNPRLVYRHGLRAEGLEQRQMLAADIPLPDTAPISTNEDTAITIDVSEYNTGDIVIESFTAGTYGSVVKTGDTTLQYTPTTDYFGPDSFTYALVGDEVGDDGTVSINVNPVNDFPVNTVPGPQTTNEDVPKSFKLSVADPKDDPDASEAGNWVFEITLTVQHGTLNLNLDALVDPLAITFTLGGNGQKSMSFLGTIENVNKVMDQVTYTPDPNFHTGPGVSESLTIVSNDLGNPDPVNLQPRATLSLVPITVISVNDAPALSGANDFTKIDENQLDNIGNLVSELIAGKASDVEDGEVTTIEITGKDNGNGVWQYGILVGETYLWNELQVGERYHSSHRLRFVPDGKNGTSELITPSVTFRAVDSEGKLSADENDVPVEATANIIVDSVNDATTIVPDTALIDVVNVHEDATESISPLGVQLSDVDDDANKPENHGVLTLATGSGGGAITVDLTGLLFVDEVTVSGTDQARTITGNIDDINTVMASAAIKYTGLADREGVNADTVTVSYLGVGESSPLELGQIQVNIENVNDAPTIAYTGETQFQVEEDVTTVIDLTGLTFGDIDSDPLALVLAVNTGKLSALPHTGVVVVGSGSKTLTLTGTKAALLSYNFADAISYTTAPNANGTDLLGIAINDLNGGETGLDQDILINITEKNDAPIITAPGPINVIEDTPKTLAGITVKDVDSATITVTLEVTDGTFDGDSQKTIEIVLNGAAGTTFTLSGITYHPAPGSTADDTLTITAVDDQDASSEVSVTLNLTEDNDAPVLDPQLVEDFDSITEDQLDNPGNLVSELLAGSVSDVDGPGLGIALIGTSTGTAGSHWEYWIDDEAGWTPVDSVDSTQALLLSADAKLRFVPDGDNGTKASVTFRAWDEFDGIQDGVKVNLSLLDASAFSTAPGTAEIQVDAINDDPTFTANLTPAVNVVEEVSKEFAIGELDINDVDAGVNGVMTLVILAGKGKLNITSTVPGIQVINNQTSAVNVNGTLAQLNAFLAGANEIGNSDGSLIYQGLKDKTGRDAIQFYVKDNGNTGLGGNTLVEIGQINVDIDEDHLDLPVLTVPSGLTATENDEEVISSGFKVKDIDTSAVWVTLTVTEGAFSSGGEKSIEFQLSSGSSAPLGEVSIPTFSYFAPDGAVATDTLVVKVSYTQGGTVETTANVPIAILQVNSAPVLESYVDFSGSITEDNLNPAGQLISELFEVSDDDGPGVGIALTGTSTGTAGGTWQYSVNGTDWTDVGTVSNGDALLLAGTTLIRFVPDGENGTTASIAFRAWDQSTGSEGDTVDLSQPDSVGGTTAFSSDEGTSSLVVTDINDAPTYAGSFPSFIQVPEDTTNAVNLSAVTLIDVDDDAVLTLTLSATNTTKPGTLSVLVPGGVVGISVVGSGTSSVAITGTLGALNALLDSVGAIRYTGYLNHVGTGADTISVVLKDDQLAATPDVSIRVDILAVNDAPVVGVPAPLSVLEDKDLPISGITITDVDAGNALLTLTLSVENGTLWHEVDDELVEAPSEKSGTLANLQSFLAGITYRPNADWFGTDKLTVTVNDNGATGIPGAKTGSNTLTITVKPENDSPLPEEPDGLSQTVDEESSFTLSYSDLIEGINAGPNESYQTLAVTAVTQGAHGTVTFDEDGQVTYTHTGTEESLEGIEDSFVVTITDGLPVGVDEEGFEPISVYRTVTVTINPVNDLPEVTMPAALNTDEDTPLVLADLTAIQVSDNDAELDVENPDTLTLTLSVDNGTLEALWEDEETPPPVVDDGDPATVVLTGTVTELNEYLLNVGVKFVPADDYFTTDDTGPVMLYASASDNGGPGAETSMEISINPVNDPPRNDNAVPDHDTPEDETNPVDLSAIELYDIEVVEVDPEADPPVVLVELKLEATEGGKLTVNPVVVPEGVQVDPLSDSAVVFTGTLEQLNLLLDTAGVVSYTSPAITSDAVDTIEITATKVDEVGDAVSAEGDIATVTVNITNDNEGPAFDQLPGEQIMLEDTVDALVFSEASVPYNAIVVSDVDSTELTVTLSVTHGTLTLGSTDGLEEGDVIISNGGRTVEVTGSIETINNALEGLAYRPDANYNRLAGEESLSITVSDGEESEDASAEVSIIVRETNDAPELQNVPSSLTTPENVPLGNLGIGLFDLDVVGAEDLYVGEILFDVQFGTLGFDYDAEFTETLAESLVVGVDGGIGEDSLTIRGTFEQLDKALARLVYTPIENYNGPDMLKITASDSGSVGIDGPLGVTAQIPITVTDINNPPSFNAGGNQTVNEDAGAQSVANWATAINAGAPDESGQTLEFEIVSNSNTGLFAVLPAISPAGTLTYTPAANLYGSAEVKVVLKDNGGGQDTSAVATFTITVNAVNDAPTFTAGGNPEAVDEDSGPQTVTGWATGISAGPNESDQTPELEFKIVSNSNPGLFASDAGPKISPTGTLTYTPAGDAYGEAVIVVELSDDSGGDDTSDPVTFTIKVNSVNDAPTFVAGGDPEAVDEDSGPQTVNGWATGMSGGPANESQTTEFVITSNSNPDLFAAGPAIDTDGNLTYTPADNANGQAVITVVLQDNDGTENDGKNSSDPVDLTITVKPVNDDPLNFGGFPASVQAVEDEWSNVDLSSIELFDFDSPELSVRLTTSAGGSIDIEEEIGNQVTTTGSLADINALLDSEDGIQFKGAANAWGTAADTITVEISDGGAWITLGEIDVNITAVNDAPSFTKGADQNPDEGAGPQTVENWATDISPGPNETDSVTFTATADKPELFSEQPAISSDGTLTYTPAQFANGMATITVYLTDNGIPAMSSAEQTFTISIGEVADAPQVTVPVPQETDEEVPLVFQEVDGNAIVVSDPDGDDMVSVKLEVTEGTLALGITQAGLTNLVVSEDGTTITFSGKVSDANEALKGLTYTPADDFAGPDTLTVTVGGDVDGSVVENSATVAITVNNVNDAPVLTLPTAAVNLVEGEWIQLGGEQEEGGPRSLGISVKDVDENVAPDEKLTLTVELPKDQFGEYLGVFQTASLGQFQAEYVLEGEDTEVWKIWLIGSADAIENDLALIRYSLSDADPGSLAFVTGTMAVDLTDVAEETVSGTVELHIADAAPTIKLADADAEDPEDPVVHDESSTEPFRLLLGPVTDAGNDPVDHVVIRWGDGFVEVFNSGSSVVQALNKEGIYASGNGTTVVSHTYPDDAAVLDNIHVSLYSLGKLVDGSDPALNQLKEYANAGNLDIDVKNVAPTAFLSTGAYQEGAQSGKLTASNIVDPSAVDAALLQLSVDFGEGMFATYDVTDLDQMDIDIPASLLADDGDKPVVVVLSDKDGGETEYRLTIPVINVAPTIGVLTNDAVRAGQLYTKTIQFTDPGADTWTAEVQWEQNGAFQTYSNVGKSFEISHTYAEASDLAKTVTVKVFDGTSTVQKTFLVKVTDKAVVSQRSVFYNNSAFGDEIDTSKVALRPGQSSGVANYTNYTKGLNGLVVGFDLPNEEDLPEGWDGSNIGLGDFEFSVWNGKNAPVFTPIDIDDPEEVEKLGAVFAWDAASKSVKITFNDGAIEDAWLQVKVKATANTLLGVEDVFYFGNVAGDVDGEDGDAYVRVNIIDAVDAYNNKLDAKNTDVSFIYDVDRNGWSNILDALEIQKEYRNLAVKVNHFTAPL